METNYSGRLVHVIVGFILITMIIIGCGGPQKQIPVTEEPEAEGWEAAPPAEPQWTEGVIVSLPVNSVQLTSGDFDDGIASYHPSGDRIAFQSNRTGKWQLFEKDLVEGTESRLLESDANDENPVWSTDGEVVLFVSNRGGDGEWDRDIYMLDPATEVVAPVTSGAGDDWYPVAVDAQRIFYLSESAAESAKPVENRANELKAVSLDGTTDRIIADSHDNFSAPTLITPDSVAVLTPEDRIAILSLNSGDSKVITPSDLRCGTSTFNPVKGWLAFTVETDGEEGLYLVNLADKVTQSLPTEGKYVRFPRFSPDGSRLLYSAEVEGNFHLFELNLAGE